jgi:hypothetical protein
MSLKSISIVFKKQKLIKIKSWTRNSLSFRKHYFQRIVAKNLKFSTCFSICDFEFALSEFNVEDSTTNRKSCEKLIWMRFFFFFLRWFVSFHSTFTNNFVKFSRCAAKFILFVDVLSSSLLQRIFHFRRTWSQKRNLFTKWKSLSSAKHIVESLKRKFQFAQHN